MLMQTHRIETDRHREAVMEMSLLCTCMYTHAYIRTHTDTQMHIPVYREKILLSANNLPSLIFLIKLCITTKEIAVGV